MKQGTARLIKFKKLKRRFNLAEWQAIGLLESLWQFTCENALDGAIGRFTNEDIAVAIEWEADADELVDALLEYGWLDTDPEFRLIVHDWSQHAPNFVKGKLAKHGRIFADKVARERDAGEHGAKQPARQRATKPSQAQKESINSR